MGDVVDFARPGEAKTDALFAMFEAWRDGTQPKPMMAVTVVCEKDGIAVYGADNRSTLEIIGLLAAAINVMHRTAETD